MTRSIPGRNASLLQVHPSHAIVHIDRKRQSVRVPLCMCFSNERVIRALSRSWFLIQTSLATSSPHLLI